jgi:hypothetical protein
MSDLEDMIEAVKQGDQVRVRALLESDDRLANQRDELDKTGYVVNKSSCPVLLISDLSAL